MGVKVGRSDTGWEISVTPMELTAKGKDLFKQDTLVRSLIFHSNAADADRLFAEPAPNA